MIYLAHKATTETGEVWYRLAPHLAVVAITAVMRAGQLSLEATRKVVLGLIGLGHDFGKFTSYFQDYLKTGKANPYKEHSYISAIWTAFLVQQCRCGDREELFAYLAVADHHRDLESPSRYLARKKNLQGDWYELGSGFADRLRIAEKQMEDLSLQVQDVARNLARAQRWVERLTGLDFPLPPWHELIVTFVSSWMDVLDRLHRIHRQVEREESLKNFYEAVHYFSALVDADKLHAARVPRMRRQEVPSEWVLRYQKRLADEPVPNEGKKLMNSVRQDLFTTVAENAHSVSLNRRIFTITAPTGSGKTVAGLAAALLFRERLTQTRNRPPRIIYALPYTSIIDDVFEKLQRMLKDRLQPTGYAEVPEAFLLKHHHLADVCYRVGDEELDLDHALLLTESWQSEIVVTTFVQLMHTLIGYRNRMLKKLCQLAGAVVIMDEVQSIPVPYWPLVAEALRQAADHLNITFIIMTATRPQWFAPDEFVELAGAADKVKERFSALNRVRAYRYPDPVNLQQAVDMFVNDYNPQKSTLVVFNTIKTSIEFYREIKARNIGDEVPLFYLSTNIVPSERQKRLAAIRYCLEQKKSLLVISTQVVEAGIDLDFDEVWRDIGPLDSIVQVAGRCNRNFTRSLAPMRVFNLHDDRGRPAVRVYGREHIRGTDRVFAPGEVRDEADFHRMVEDYHAFVSTHVDTSKSSAILRAMAALEFQPREWETVSVADFRLIRDLPSQIEVFVPLDEAAQEVWQAFADFVLQEKDIAKRQRAYLALRRAFTSYLLSVPARFVVDKLTPSSGVNLLPVELVSEFYDPETGFKRWDDEGALIL